MEIAELPLENQIQPRKLNFTPRHLFSDNTNKFTLQKIKQRPSMVAGPTTNHGKYFINHTEMKF